MSRDAERHGTTEEGVETEAKKQGKSSLHSCAVHVFCPGFQKGRVPSEKGTFSGVSEPSKGQN